MRKKQKLIILLSILAFTFTSICTIKAQTQENMKTFFDSEIPGIRIQVNATAESQPIGNITVILSLKRVTDVDIKYFNFSVFGFLNGTYKTLMANITDYNFSLGDIPQIYNCTFKVHEQVWDVTYGEITLKYDVKYTISPGPGLQIMPYGLAFGFPMTRVENVYLKNLEEQFENLNKTYWELLKNYTELQGSQSELGNTRIAVGVLAIATVFFVATTLYLVMRKPKQYW